MAEPMAHRAPPTQFAGKTWIFIAQALVFGALSLFGFLLGPLFLLQIVKDARGRPATDAGVALLLVSVPMLLVFLLAVFNIVARRQPLIRLCREGLAINVIGSSTLDGVFLIPGIVRVAWLIISLQGFGQQMLLAPWQSLQQARVSGPPMARTLTIIASLYRPADPQASELIPVAKQIAFREVAFRTPLEQIAQEINRYSKVAESRNSLPSWDA